jgi:hypothetical protein
MLEMRGRSPYLAVLAVLSLGIRAAFAGECRISGARYQLQSDTVQWLMQIHAGQSCVRGVRFSNVAFDKIKLISPPHYGQVTLLGSGFSYRAKSDFQGEDSFVIGVSGAIKKVSGTSTIHIVVSLGDVSPPRGRAEPVWPNHPPAPVPVPFLKVSPTRAVGDTAPSPAGASPPTCPTWDWSSGSPPPMQRPFDASKLYCPPPPFNPPGLSVGCICPR